MPDDDLWEVLPFDAGSFTFPADEPWPGEEGVVVAHLLRAGDGRLFLFDTGIGAGHPALDARYHPVERNLGDALAALGHGIAPGPSASCGRAGTSAKADWDDGAGFPSQPRPIREDSRMHDWRSEMELALADFARASEALGHAFPGNDVQVAYLPAPHRPQSLPVGSIAVYAFWWDGQWLKIGKAGPGSGPRYASHHYNVSARSSLARSLMADPRMAAVPDFDPTDPGAWVRNRTSRVNITMSATRLPAYLSFLEAILHLRLNPRYEGPLSS